MPADRMEPGVDGAQVVDLHGLDGLDGLPGDEVVLVINARQALEGVEQGGGGGAHQVGGLAGDHLAAGQLNGSGGVAGLLGHLGGGGHHTMAGAQLRETSLEAAVDMLKQSIDMYYKNNHIAD